MGPFLLYQPHRCLERENPPPGFLKDRLSAGTGPRARSFQRLSEVPEIRTARGVRRITVSLAAGQQSLLGNIGLVTPLFPISEQASKGLEEDLAQVPLSIYIAEIVAPLPPAG
jgi:hypothetical protein